MLLRVKNRYLSVALVALSLIDVGLMSPTFIKVTASPSSSSDDSSSDGLQDSSDSSFKTQDEKLPPTTQSSLPSTLQTSSYDTQTWSPLFDSSTDEISLTEQETLVFSSFDSSLDSLLPATTLLPTTSESSTFQLTSQMDEVLETQQQSLSTKSTSANSSEEEFYSLTDEFFQWKLQIFPEFASYIGLNEETAGHLSKLSTEHFQERKLKVTNFLQRAEAIDASKFSENVSLFYRVFLQELKGYLDNFQYVNFYVPFTNSIGPHTYLEYLVSKLTVLETHSDYLKLLSRYSEFPRQIDESLTLMRKGIAEGMMPSNWSLSAVPRQIESLLVSVKESLFYKPFINISINLTPEEKEALRQQALARVSGIMAALMKLKDFVESEYIPASRPSAGVSTLPNGLDYYKACLKFHTTTDMTPQEVHDLGLSEVSRIRKEVEKVGAALGFPNKTLSEISEIMKNDPDQKFKSKEDLLDTYRDLVYKKLYPVMHRVVDEISSINVTVEGKSGGYVSYRNPPTDGSGPGTFYVNTKLYEHHLRNEITAWALHETVPGHHLHSTTLMANKAVPQFLRSIGPFDMRDVPTKFPLYTAYKEGWGLYAEYLGEELGLYEDPNQRFGRYSIESLRACRLVVDTGIHAFGWTRQEAIDYLLENTAMTEAAVRSQIDRYITQPGQAAAYKIGEIKIIQLRRNAEERLGSLFRPQDFHKVVLGCPAPLNILEECVNSYINTLSKN